MQYACKVGSTVVQYMYAYDNTPKLMLPTETNLSFLGLAYYRIIVKLTQLDLVQVLFSLKDYFFQVKQWLLLFMPIFLVENSLLTTVPV